MRKKKKDDRDPFFKTLNILSPFRCSKARHIRIADILVDEELGSETDGYDCSGDFNMERDPHRLPEDDGFMALQCSSPLYIISRWLSTLKRGKRRRCGVVRSQKRPKEVAKTERETGDDESTHATGSTKGLNGGGGETESRQIVKDTSSFNLGVACGLVYLIVAGKNELAKTAELRAEMEQLLQNAKEELQSKNSRFGSRPVESNEMNFASSTTDLQQASSSSSESRFSLQSGLVREVCSEFVRNGRGQGERDECVEGMDQLEAELESELERLQLHLELDSENHSSNSNYTQQQRLNAVQDTAHGTGDDTSDFGEEIDAHGAEPADYNEIPCDYGVPALELERRLHELLEARQEERIKELEVALEYTKRKLHEKEMEVSWWRQNASAALTSHRHQDPSSSGASQHSSESTFHLFRNSKDIESISSKG
ncbi:protein POLAR-like 1 [Malus domestica]|uniref:protein POLAR-like 1 n=1 Tax=Malus domestica TaxID=3750 RepID=UPI003975BE3F